MTNNLAGVFAANPLASLQSTDIMYAVRSGADAGITVANAFGNFVTGPATATDNAIARFDLTTGKIIQNSALLISDTGNLSTTNNISIQCGVNAVASGTTCFAFGPDNNVSGNGSIGVGGNNIVLSGTNCAGFGTAAQSAYNNCFIWSIQGQPMIASGDNQFLAAAPGGFLINTNNPVASVYFAKGSGAGSFMFNGSASVSSGSMANNDVNIYTSGSDLILSWKDNTGVAHTFTVTSS